MTSESVIEPKDIVEDVVELVEDGGAIIRNGNVSRAILLVISFTAGAAVSHYITKKKLEKKYSDISKAEIIEAREYYARQLKPASPAELAANYNKEIAEANKKVFEDEANNPLFPSDDLKRVKEITKSYQSDDVERARAMVEASNQNVAEETVVETVTSHNVFTDSTPTTDWDYEEEIAARTDEMPYIIHHDEFMGGEKDYQQTSLTYYEGDDVLTDDKDQPINETDDLVGDNNLLKFGHGSKDNNIVYIRNDRLELEFEVVRHHGTFTQQVLGYIEHSDDDKRPRRFRNYDD